MKILIQKCKETFPHCDAGDVIHSFTGARAKNSRGDWIIEHCASRRGVVHAAGIDSPGLAGSPAIAVEVSRLLGEAGLDLVRNPEFNPCVTPAPHHLATRLHSRACCGGVHACLARLLAARLLPRSWAGSARMAHRTACR